MALLANSYEKENLATGVFISYIATSFICLSVYIGCFVYVFKRKQADEKNCCDLWRYGSKILFLLSWPIVSNSFIFIDSCVGTISYFCG